MRELITDHTNVRVFVQASTLPWLLTIAKQMRHGEESNSSEIGVDHAQSVISGISVAH